MSGTAGKNGRGAERGARETGSRPALAEQSPRGQADLSHRQEKAYTDSQRDMNEGTINVLRSMHAKLMTLQGQTGKNSGYPYFDTQGVPQVP